MSSFFKKSLQKDGPREIRISRLKNKQAQLVNPERKSRRLSTTFIWSLQPKNSLHKKANKKYPNGKDT